VSDASPPHALEREEHDERRPAWLGVGSAAVILLIAIATGVGTLPLGYWTPIGPGAGFFPLVIAVVLAAASITWGLSQWRGTEPAADVAGADADIERPASLGRIVVTLASLLALAALLEILGFQLAVLLFLFFHLKVLGSQRWRITVPVAVAGSFGLYLLFDKVLSVSLPNSSIPLLSGLGF
jgi:putative tricarboxylic transport membrane protein